jgi:hypothetical protein
MVGAASEPAKALKYIYDIFFVDDLSYFQDRRQLWLVFLCRTVFWAVMIAIASWIKTFVNWWVGQVLLVFPFGYGIFAWQTLWKYGAFRWK